MKNYACLVINIYEKVLRYLAFFVSVCTEKKSNFYRVIYASTIEFSGFV